MSKTGHSKHSHAPITGMQHTPRKGASKCFVCGKTTQTLAELMAHMRTEHMVERDWLECTLCGCPVRDMRLHHQACHRGMPRPPGPDRVQRFYYPKADGEFTATKSRLNKRWQSGEYFSEKMQRMMHYRSSWELSIIQVFDTAPAVTSFTAEPFSIPYVHGVRPARYIPDFHVRFTDGTNMILEIKPQNQCTYAINLAKWQSAQAYCKQHGFIFRVWTEGMIKKLRRIARNPNDLTCESMCV